MIISRVEVIPLSVPLEEPVQTSFGTMHARNSVLLRLETDNGLSGIGESWINFPSWGLDERCGTLAEGVAPLLLGKDPCAVEWIQSELSERLQRVGLQWGAHGPIAQAMSAVDIALWDLVGKATDAPLYRLLGGRSSETVPLYASGIGPKAAERQARAAAESGFEAVKIKIGFSDETDRRNVENVRKAIGPDVRLVVDANQGWRPEDAIRMDGCLQDHGVEWLEEPILAHHYDELRTLRQQIETPIAAGENVYGCRGFRELLSADCVDIVQPDVTKTGGISEMRAVIQMARAWDKPYAPHFLGAGIGLIASAHLFATLPGGIALEYDVNPNPLRQTLLEPAIRIENGRMVLPDGPGLGVTLDEDTVERYVVQGQRKSIEKG